MAQIPRPPKQGNVMTYVAKVAAGYPHILAGEVDADLDTIYGAWNSGADTVNIRDGAITSAKLAADSVGPRELQDSGIGTTNLADAAVTTPKLADGAVTDPKIASVAWAKVTGAPSAPSTLPPSGPAGGDLVGTYPNPTIRGGAVTSASLAAASIGSREIADGQVGTAELGDLQVTREKLAVYAALGANVSAANPTGFVLSTAGVWTTYATLPSLTTRGGAVLLLANAATSVTALTNAGACSIRWLRDGAAIAGTSWLIVAPSPNATPLPGLHWIDRLVGAGAHTYVYQVMAGANATIVSSSQADTGFLALEIG